MLGKVVLAEELVNDDGSVELRYVPLERIPGSKGAGDDDAGLPDQRELFTLSPDYDAANPYRIGGAGARVKVAMAGPFEKYEILTRVSIEVLIAFDREASPEDYDDVLLPGQASRMDRCPPANNVSLYFVSAPAAGNDVEVILYSGRSADPV